ncbi:acetyl-CoA carboxylase biotin carboxylase subunit [Saccharopolyspora sp. 5N708]|uniref:acetyl-CoA carboxylase biotin carboxylase subunit n=1 Tax=Saccharopolyspora sp. 5N708 TaxID=3457424 RepID=UPI003FD1D2BA
MIDSLLVANRGEIAGRIIRTAKRLGIRTVAVYSDVDENLPHVREADEAVHLGPAPPAASYCNISALLDAARRTGSQAVHPGYGFLSEDAKFAQQVQESGLLWVGPDPFVIDQLGDKVNARNIAMRAGVPVAPGSAEPPGNVAEAVAIAADIGYPVMLKAAAGGGGTGILQVADEAALRAGFERLQAFAGRMFDSPKLIVERFFPRARHVEVQILGLADGRVLALGERDCSVQRRNQKVVEETPAPGLPAELRRRMLAAAVRLGEAVGYRNAGTVEFLVSGAEFVFLEMNTRLQVEHPITERVFGIDLVEQQLRIAAGLAPSVDVAALVPTGHAIELRVNAEDPVRFLPGPGAITEWQPPADPEVRVDAGYGPATTVTPHYDPLLAKVIVHGADRAEALRKAAAAVAGFRISGPKHNLPFLARLLATPEFASGDYGTDIVTRIQSKER